MLVGHRNRRPREHVALNPATTLLLETKMKLADAGRACLAARKIRQRAHELIAPQDHGDGIAQPPEESQASQEMQIGDFHVNPRRIVVRPLFRRAARFVARFPDSRYASLRNEGTMRDGAEAWVQDLASRSPAWRWVIHRDGIVLEDRRGVRPTPAPEGEIPHEALLELAAEGTSLAGGYRIETHGSTVVVEAPVAPTSLDDLVQERWLSELAAATLDRALRLGRNVLVVGRRAPAWVVTRALVAGGGLPGALGRWPAEPPRGWVATRTIEASRALGLDRVALMDGEPTEILEAAMSSNGLVAWMPSHGFEQALLRLEASAERGRPGIATPLQVLASLDLIVVVAPWEGEATVTQVMEIRLADEGYVPTPLFLRGRLPAPDALSPTHAPSFLGELRRIDGTLADELDAAVSRDRPAGPPRGERPPDTVPAVETMAEPTPGEPSIPSAPPRAHEAAISGPPADAPGPGWELDQLGDAAEGSGIGLETGPEDAAMAATFGLGPPPRPAGVSLNAEDEVTFAKALEAARRVTEEEGDADDGG